MYIHIYIYIYITYIYIYLHIINIHTYNYMYMCLVYIHKNITLQQISWCDLNFAYFSLLQSEPHVPIGYVCISHSRPTIVGIEPHVS